MKKLIVFCVITLFFSTLESCKKTPPYYPPAVVQPAPVAVPTEEDKNRAKLILGVWEQISSGTADKVNTPWDQVNKTELVPCKSEISNCRTETFTFNEDNKGTSAVESRVKTEDKVNTQKMTTSFTWTLINHILTITYSPSKVSVYKVVANTEDGELKLANQKSDENNKYLFTEYATQSPKN